jgi:Zn-dependent peptidase ImmA (M78 family)
MVKGTRLENRARQVLKQTGIDSVPVPIHLVAKRLGLLVEGAKLGDEVSGILVVEGGRGVIGYNIAHPLVRQRFTIAHELGHYVLHSSDSTLFIDEHYFAAFRDRRSGDGTDAREREANSFAACLLMPAHLLKHAIENRRLDLGDEDGLGELARLFQVSSQAMMFRLANLGLLPIAA